MDLSRYSLYPHQQAGVEFLARRGRAILGDDMGLGKTRQAIIALNAYIARLLDAKLKLVQAVEADEAPDSSVLKDLQEELTRLGPALLQEAKAARAVGQEGTRLDIIGEMVAALPQDAPLLETGSWEFPSSSDPKKSYRVTFGRGGHLQCTCPGFEYRGECKHVREVRKTALGA